jgi:signal transduction histidine kinase
VEAIHLQNNTQMHLALKPVLELILANSVLSNEQKAALEKAMKEADKALVIAEFKLGRFEKEKKSLAVLLEETIEELQKKTFAVEQANVEVTRALLDLKSAQSQLIQSEKMASLGELTAGIAHEIQNPLNFVNNFSELTEELVKEMEIALQMGRTDEAMVVVEEIKQNIQKIIHHGKRADSIVKGMLQHSRKNDGQKSLTDLNALVDEYLRLSYHGLRAKDKSFNAAIQTRFDERIGDVEVVAQDIGRVLLNLFNNAFYAVNEKKRSADKDYEPTIQVMTRLDDDKVKIRVKDNGIGIPQRAMAKIFQPFFTTKPAGSGTGLGLSLSYDIVKMHGGELKVKSIEGEETEFTIVLNKTEKASG